MLERIGFFRALFDSRVMCVHQSVRRYPEPTSATNPPRDAEAGIVPERDLPVSMKHV